MAVSPIIMMVPLMIHPALMPMMPRPMPPPPTEQRVQPEPVPSYSLPPVQPQDLPANTIDCHAFTKTGQGQWKSSSSTFSIGDSGDMTISQGNIPPGKFYFGAYDLFTVLDTKCGGAFPP